MALGHDAEHRLNGLLPERILLFPRLGLECVRHHLHRRGVGFQRHWFGETLAPAGVVVFPRDRDVRINSSLLAGGDVVRAAIAGVGQ